MKVTRLKLANVRAIRFAEFCFQPGFNLIVGANGVGKTTVLDTLAVCLSAIAGATNRFSRRRAQFGVDDIRLNADTLQAECEFEVGGAGHRYFLDRFRKSSPLNVPSEWTRDTERIPRTSKVEGFEGGLPPSGAGGNVLAVMFSTRRSVASDRRPSRSGAQGDVSAAFSGALVNTRGLHLAEFADWMRAQTQIQGEHPEANRKLTALDKAVARFLPGYRNLRPAGADEKSLLLIDHGDHTLPVRNLSDGERGLLALVLDLTRRLAQANEWTADPAAGAEAVVLIDELELHLHPAWQRRVVTDLTKTFPKCQFIATTHSPQVIGELESDRVHIMADGEVYSPAHSFGVDSSRVLEEVMDAHARNFEIQELLQRISDRVGDDRYGDARKLLDQLAARVGEGDPEVTRVRTLLDFLEDE